MNHWIMAPIVIPAVMAPFLILAARWDLALQRVLSVTATALLLPVAILLYAQAAGGAPQPYLLGDWPAPFGIVLVLDRLSALMILLMAVLALAVVLFAIDGWDTKGRHFHALFQFQLMGINGAFLTGDLFNLFVFFEVLLIASYGLMLHGGGPRRLRAGFQYVAINLIGSTLFLFAVGLIYATTGTLNMADLAVKVATVAPADAALLRIGGLLLLLVFAIKAALVPLHWWLPTAYAAASAPAAALFAIMTKVGAYSILRVYTLIFGTAAGPFAFLAEPWVLPAALLTLVLGMVGVLASRTLLDLVCFSVVGSMGMLLIPLGLFDIAGVTVGLYYLVHSTLTGAVLFLLVDLVAERRGAWLDRLQAAPPFREDHLLAGLFFAAAIAMVGMPPLSGFIGKLLILDAARTSVLADWIWWVVLTTSLIALVGFARAGSVVFWKSASVNPDRRHPPRKVASALGFAAAGALLLGTVGLTVFAGPITADLELTARQLLDPGPYVRAVLGSEAMPAEPQLARP